jgi:hypothetical protein
MNEDFAILLFFFGISVTANLGLVVALWRTARRVKRLETLTRDLSLDQPEGASEGLEQAVRALTAQVDSLASGQDFLNRVVADRLDRLARGLPAADPDETPR